jgi:hypothetical protein
MFSVAKVIPQLLQGKTLTVGGIIIALGPTGETDVLKERDPEKILNELMVMFDTAEWPGRIVTGFGLAVREKSPETPDNLQAVNACISQPE